MSHEEDKQHNQELPERVSQESAPEAQLEGAVPGEKSDQASETPEAQVAASEILVLTGIVSDVKEDPLSSSRSDEGSSADPFEVGSEDVPDAEEVAARDEKISTAPAALRSSVQLAMEQHPPRRAKLNDGPRSRMLAELIPEVIIPTNTLDTRGFSRVNVTEGGSSQLEEGRSSQQSDGSASSTSGAASSQDGQTSASQSDTPSDEMSLEELINKIDGKEGALAGQASTLSDAGVAGRSTRPSVSKRKRGLRKPKLSPLKIAILVVAAILAIALALAGLFAWDRWYRYDDAQDMLGEWKMTNAERTMVFTEAVMKINDEVYYRYTLDTKEKTITYSFGDSQGTASYRFSPDRQTLIIDEKGGVDWLVALHVKSDPVLEDRDVPDGVTKLQKVSDDTDAAPQDTEEITTDDSSWFESVFIPGYNEFKRPSIGKTDSKDSKKKSAEGADADDDSDEDAIDDGAVYVDKETGNRYYYDSNQVLYYDQYGNYYYDMYGNNPYEAYTESGTDDYYMGY